MTDTDTSPLNATRKPASPERGDAHRWLFYLVPVAALAVPFLFNDYLQYVANLMLVYVLVAVGFNIVLGNLGQLAFANTAFFGMGAYATGLLMAKLAVPFWIAIWAGGLAGALAGFLASAAALRGIRMYYLAIMTLAFGELMRWTYIHAEAVTEGSSGLGVPTATVFGIPLDTEAARFYVFLAIVTLVVKATANLLRSRVGRAFQAIKDNELATAALGIPTSRYVILAFVWSGAVVGIAGGMFAIALGRVVPESFNLLELIMHFAMVMVGGVGSLAGSVLGGVVITAAPELFRSYPGMQELFLAVLIAFVLLFMPRGLASLLARVSPLFRERFYRE
ncbi:branched-chain amino acid ABC transporter permease [Kaustia mangrovi]|uniref:Branched-chain amino acid ABC transporter permease n=1 Tax=Kaustia mangrovi TaxID=2593653 RepID=A0A7S8HB79_9HYPH|nr:branched-chain amino acid ABC transporter permease [Kaustia mangrovi]QPC42357.1 branched-chain amino acid ABC transporter permease [Kaustia mangrovi]